MKIDFAITEVHGDLSAFRIFRIFATIRLEYRPASAALG